MQLIGSHHSPVTSHHSPAAARCNSTISRIPGGNSRELLNYRREFPGIFKIYKFSSFFPVALTERQAEKKIHKQSLYCRAVDCCYENETLEATACIVYYDAMRYDTVDTAEKLSLIGSKRFLLNRTEMNVYRNSLPRSVDNILRSL